MPLPHPRDHEGLRARLFDHADDPDETTANKLRAIALLLEYPAVADESGSVVRSIIDSLRSDATAGMLPEPVRILLEAPAPPLLSVVEAAARGVMERDELHSRLDAAGFVVQQTWKRGPHRGRKVVQRKP